eukprot:4308-Prorocentrum_lima.AAC.1
MTSSLVGSEMCIRDSELVEVEGELKFHNGIGYMAQGSTSTWLKDILVYSAHTNEQGAIYIQNKKDKTVYWYQTKVEAAPKKHIYKE